MADITPEALSDLIGQIYDCALEAAGWPAALTRINALASGAYASITLSKVSDRSVVLKAHSPWDEKMLRIVDEDYGIDGVPGAREVMDGPLDVPLSASEIIKRDDPRFTGFLMNWAKPQGLGDGCMMKFVQTGGRFGALSLVSYASRKTLLTAEERRMLSLVSPHLRRAAMIGDLLKETREETNLFRGALDKLATPVVLVNSASGIVHCNPAAEAMLSAEKPVFIRERKLSAKNRFGMQALQEAVAMAGSSNSGLGPRGVGIPLHMAGDAPAVAYVLPIEASGPRQSGLPACAAIFISTASHSMPPPEDALRTLFGLTPGEARVFLKIGAGAAPAEIADESGVSINTVRAQMAQIFAKTGTSRQAELVRIVEELGPV